MKINYVLLISLLIVGVLFIPAVSAETILDEEPTLYEDTGGTLKYSATESSYYKGGFNRIRLELVETRSIMPYIGVTLDDPRSSQITGYHAEGRFDITYTVMGQTKPATMHVEYGKNYFGTVTQVRYLIFFEDWDNSGYTGTQYITLSKSLWSGTLGPEGSATSSLACMVTSEHSSRRSKVPFTITVVSVNDWKNRLIVNDDILHSYEVNLQRVYGGDMYPSEITILKGNSTVFYEASASDFSTVYPKSEMDAIKIQVGSEVFQWHLEPAGPDEPDGNSVTVYIKNSQTGALIANANIAIDALVNGEYYPVVNRTEPSGIFTINLQPTGGGQVYTKNS